MAVKTINGIPIANIKTINGTPIANIKSLLGVDLSSSYVTSVQNVSVTIAASATSNTATITSVNTALAVVFYGGANSTEGAGTTWDVAGGRIELTNSTTVTAYRNTSGSNTLTILCTIVEFTSAAIQSIQAGTIAFAGTGSTATITSVTTANSAVIFLGTSGSIGNFNAPRYQTHLVLTNSTTVTATKQNSAGSVIVGFMVVEFKSAVIQSIQQVVSTFTATTNTVDTTTITSVNTANTMLIWNNALNDQTHRATLTNATTLSFTRVSIGSLTFTIVTTVIEFVTGVLNSVQRGTIAVNSATSNTATITSVNTAKAFTTFQGFSSDFAVAQPDAVLPSVALTDATTVTANKGGSGATATTVGYEVVEFL